MIRAELDVTPKTGVDTTITYDLCLPYKVNGCSGCVIDVTIHRKSHAHPLFKQDNATVFMMIKDAVHGTHDTISFDIYGVQANKYRRGNGTNVDLRW